jgi:hypothetical protein
MKPDWKDAPAWAKFLAMDISGAWFWFEEEPFFNIHTWLRRGESDTECKLAAAPLTAKDTLEGRPNE